MSVLLDKQQLFARTLAEFITWIYTHEGWEITFGDGNIDPRRKFSIDGKTFLFGRDCQHLLKGAHYRRLGQDINLFIDDLFIDSDNPAWHELGEKWKSMNPLCRWGGDFAKPDYNHFSFEDEGYA